MTDLVIVTGASSSHWSALRNLLYSRDLFEPRLRVVIYDLGLEIGQLEELAGREVRRFRFERHAPHVGIEARTYAWKPIVIAEVLSEVRGPLLWLDAGDLILARLHWVRAVLARQGFYCPRGQGSVRRWTRVETLRALSASPDVLERPARNAAIVGVTPQVSSLVEMWRLAALDPDILTGSSRQDQALLSILAYLFLARFGYQFEDQQLDISDHNDGLSLDEVKTRLSGEESTGRETK